MSRTISVSCLLLLGALAICQQATVTARAPQQLKPLYANMKLFFCAYGSVGFQPIHPPPGYENELAVAVIEVNSSVETPNAPLPKITLFDRLGRSMLTKRVISVEVFDERYVEHEGNFAYYLDTKPGSRSYPWGEKIPSGMVHLRIRVALATENSLNAMGGRCRVTIGPYSAEGPVDGVWAT